MKYEYIRIRFDFDDLEEMNRFSRDGWRVAAVIPNGEDRDLLYLPYWALLERVLPKRVCPATSKILKCVCAQGVTKCPRHGDQPALRELCPRCKTNVIGYCPEGEYCTSDICGYVV